jgi:DNA-binding beta-propeller fold protein YncE
MRNHVAMLLVSGLLSFPAMAIGQAPPALSLKMRIPLPNVNGRMDHLSVDQKGARLFLSALGNNTVEVLDLKGGQRIRTIGDLKAPQGVFYDASTNRLFVASEDGTTKIFDGTTFQLLQTVKFEDDADNIRYDARSNRAIVGYGGGKEIRGRPLSPGALAFVDSSGKKSGEIAVDSHPESFQLEKAGTRLFVNIPDKKEIQVADVAKGMVLESWSIASAQNFPMALDEGHKRLFVGCRVPARMLVLDTTTGKTVATFEAVGDTDDLFYDVAKSRIYVIGGEGFVDVFQQKDADHYERTSRAAIPPGSRTGLFVPDMNTLFVSVPHRGAQGSEVLVYETK